MGKTELIILFKSSKMAEAIAKIAGKLTHLVIPPDIEFVVALEVDETVHDVLSKDPLLQQQKHEGILKVYNKLVDTIGKSYKEASDAIVQDPLSADDKAVEIGKKRQEEMDKALNEAVTEVQKIWAELVKSKGQYAAYKTKAAVRLVLDAAALGMAIASTAAAAATFGGTTVITIIALIRTSAKLAQDIRDATKHVEKAVDDLQDCLEKIADTCIREAAAARGEKNANKLKAAGLKAKDITKQVGGLLENEVLGTNFIGTFMGTLKEAKNLAKVAKQKVNGANVKAHKLAQLLPKLVSKQKRLGLIVDYFDEQKKAGELSTKEIKKLSKLKDKLKTTEKTLDATVKGVPAQLQRFKTLDERLNTLLGYYKEIKAQQKDRAKFLKVLEAILSLKDIALAAVDAASLAEAATSMAEATVEFIADKVIDAATDKLIQLAVDKYYGTVNTEVTNADTKIAKEFDAAG